MSSASTVLFFATIAVVVVLAPGSEVVAERFLSPQHLWQSLVGSEGLPSVLGAFLLNVEIFMISEVLAVVRELAHEGMTMVIATHEMGFARDIADRVCFLEDGRILEQGQPEKIFTAPEHHRTRQFLGRIIDAGRL